MPSHDDTDAAALAARYLAGWYTAAEDADGLAELAEGLADVYLAASRNLRCAAAAMIAGNGADMGRALAAEMAAQGDTPEKLLAKIRLMRTVRRWAVGSPAAPVAAEG